MVGEINENKKGTKMKIENKTEECGTRVIICIDLKDYFIT